MTNKQENTRPLHEVTKWLQDFLTSKASENIVLTGEWGSGKTEVWKRAVASIQKKSFRYNTGLWVVFFCIILLPIINIIIPLYPNILSFLQTYKYPSSILYISFSLFSLGAFYYCLNRRDKSFARMKYAYVSAGDCETLKDLKEKIIFSTLMSWEAGKALTPVKVFVRDALRPGFWTGVFLGIICLLCYLFKDEVSDYFLAYWKLILPAPIIAAIVGSIFNFFRDHRRYYLERNAIICIDDIERAKKLDPQDILHLASDLRDNKNCKVALILNPDQFPAESEEEAKRKSAAFQKVLEKGSNGHLLLELSPQKAAYLAFTDKEEKEIKDQDDPIVRALRPIVIQLGINNIRIIQHIWNDLKRLQKFLEMYEITPSSQVSSDFIILSAFSGSFYYLHFKKILEREKKDIEKCLVENEKRLPGTKLVPKSKLEILQMLTWREAYTNSRLVSPFSEVLCELAVTNIFMGSISIKHDELSKIMKAVSSLIEHQSKENQMKKEVQELCNILKFRITETAEELNKLIDEKVSQLTDSDTIDQIGMVQALEITLYLEAFCNESKAEDFARKWVKSDTERASLDTDEDFFLERDNLERYKKQGSKAAIILEAYLAGKEDLSKKNSTVEELSKKWLFEDEDLPLSEFRKLATQESNFWVALFKREHGVGRLSQFFNRNHLLVNSDKNTFDVLWKHLQEALKLLSEESPIYQKRYAQYLSSEDDVSDT